MSKRNNVLIISVILVLLGCMFLTVTPTNVQASATEHVYYGYVPPSTDVVQWPTLAV